ncbi:MAG: CehA/McbA family metallohydrolase [Fuerstiella sp.]
MTTRIALQPLCLLLLTVTFCSESNAQQITEANYDQLVPIGKEVDAIYGDYVIANDKVSAVIAAPKFTRNANMTVRYVGGCLIDLAANGLQSDQLSAFYPGRTKFRYQDAEVTDSDVSMISTGGDSRPECKVTYRPLDGHAAIEITSTFTNTTKSDWTLPLEDSLRIDSGNEDVERSKNGTADLFYSHDIYWKQAYGVIAPGYKLRINATARESRLNYESTDGQPVIMKPGESFTFTRIAIVGRNLPEVRSAAAQLLNQSVAVPVELTIRNSKTQVEQLKTVADLRITLMQNGTSFGTIVTDNEGIARTSIVPGEYQLAFEYLGTQIPSPVVLSFSKDSALQQLELDLDRISAGWVQTKIVDQFGKPIPAKVEFIGNGNTPTPDWGPDSAEHFVRNLAYTANGTFEAAIPAGIYDVTISHGPEYDAVFTQLSVSSGKLAKLNAELKHSVQTPGWVSTEYHSHSSPSGDNTSSQRGRVLNLLAEQIDFAPCTEHNRVETYADDIAALGAEKFLATVSGMELTGKPLPLNHQNVFPMIHRPRTQDGGGPITDDSPESQIERLMIWDNRSRKLIQQNHPDLGWLFYDKDGDGTADKGFERSFPHMDVVEIHPIDRILDRNQFDDRKGKPFNNNRMLNWLQLLNQGFRIYGVVNTDAHYNYHGSGWIRNWVQSSTDEPTKIDSQEMVIASEEGRLIMSNGPYLEATFKADGQTAVSGQDLTAKSGTVNATVKVQCANWLDVDTVFVLVNGRQVPELVFTRENNPTAFGNDVVKFQKTLDIKLEEDSHLVVVTGHRTTKLGSVMGPSGGAQRPAAVTNPVFVDVDGNGFKPNQDTLGYPLPVKFKKQ